MQQIRVDVELAREPRHHVNEASVLELSRRHVDRDRQQRQSVAVPVGELPAHLPQHPHSELEDEAALLGYRNEAPRGYETEMRMIPPHQRLESRCGAGFEIERGLILEEQLIAVDRAS